jgi:CheY-like chemotaxis protein
MKKVLVIEDDLNTIDVMDYLIQDIGFEVIKSYALPTVQEITCMHPDVIMIDYYMPNGKGDELCVQLKADAWTKAIPLILMSTHTDISAISKECHADAYLAKPFGIDSVISMLNRLAN